MLCCFIVLFSHHNTDSKVRVISSHVNQGTPVLFLLSSALHDEDEWEKPHTFNPDHFLDDDGNFRKREAFLPFSAGKCEFVYCQWVRYDWKCDIPWFISGPRVCAGESLARMELFLFFTSLLQRFRFAPPPGVTEDELDLTLVGTFTQSPLLHQLCAISRDW